MSGKAKFLFQIMLWGPLIAGCVLLVSLFPPYRKTRDGGLRGQGRSTETLDEFGHPLTPGMLGPKKS